MGEGINASIMPKYYIYNYSRLELCNIHAAINLNNKDLEGK